MESNSIISKKRFDNIIYSIAGTNENIIDSNILVEKSDVFRFGLPVDNGVYDNHMGTTDYSWFCKTCGNNKGTCPGHFGLIKLKYPVKSPLFFKYIHKWLKIVCHKCSRLLYQEDINIYNNDNYKKLNEYVKLSSTIKECSFCGTKVDKIIKDKHYNLNLYINVLNNNVLEKEYILNHTILNIFNKILDEEVLKVYNNLWNHPKKYIIYEIAVPPNTIRPNLKSIGITKTGLSDVTNFLKQIIDTNKILPIQIPDEIDKDLISRYYYLELIYYEMVRGISNDKVINIKTNTGKLANNIASRIPKKTGRIRKNLMGKRVKKMFRSVISGDANFALNELGIPLSIAKNISIPEKVTYANYNRLNTYYNNSDKIYPGCKEIIKKENEFKKIKHDVNILKDKTNYKLKIGDIVLRNMIDGDYINFNRQPSLEACSISSMKVKVIFRGSTIRMNVSSCAFFNADFDGDAMNGIVSTSLKAKNELISLSNIGNWIINYKNLSCKIGLFQDSLIGIFEYSLNKNIINKWKAMDLFANVYENIDIDNYELKKENDYREILSYLLPKINIINKKSSFYKEQFSKYIKYNKDDIKVNIKNGNYINGVLDKSAVGQGGMNTLFSEIYNKYGSLKTMDVIYNLQKFINNYILYNGITCSIKDILIPSESIKNIILATNEILQDSYKITELLDKNLLKNSNMSIKDYYEKEQINALTINEKVYDHILKNCDFYNNGLYKLVFSGSKGKLAHILVVNGVLGQQSMIPGKRIQNIIGYNRNSPYFLDFDISPESSGFIKQSLIQGISPDVFIYYAAVGRNGLISNALSTSISGSLSRIAIKNLENIIINNNSLCVKNQNIIQFTYIDIGYDIRSLQNIYLEVINYNDNDFIKNYKSDTSLFGKKNNSKLKNILDNEFNILQNLRNKYISIYKKIEIDRPNQILFSNKIKLPVNIDNIVYNTYMDYKNDLNNNNLDPIKSFHKINELCDYIDYLKYNDNYYKNKGIINDYIIYSTFLLKLSVRSSLSLKILKNKNITDELLDIIINNIKMKLKNSLIDYGSLVGIISAQAVSEPMTQYMLDSKHRSTEGGSETNALVRMKEILNVKSDDEITNPITKVFLKSKYENNKQKVEMISNNIEMLILDEFIDNITIFYEQIGKIVHPDYIKENAFINKFLDIYRIPNKFTKYNWCIRFELNKMKLITKHINLDYIITKLRNKYNEIYFVFTPINNKHIILRCYILDNSFKKNENHIEKVIKIKDILMNTLIRGINNITKTSVEELLVTKFDKSNNRNVSKIYYIKAYGYNLSEILLNPYVDIYRTQSDSINEMCNIYGIDCARNHIIYEMKKAMDSTDDINSCIYSDEMTYLGYITSVTRKGLKLRNYNSAYLRMSFQGPIQVIENAAINNVKEKVNGLSANLMLGQRPNVGTGYNKIIVNRDFVNNYISQNEDIDLDDI